MTPSAKTAQAPAATGAPIPGAPYAPLPIPLTRFIGRAAVLADLERMLDDSRLLTITGAGGSGKTRLALEAARRAARDAPADVVWVELATVTQPELVPQHVAASLGLREEGGRDAFGALLAFARERPLLFVLDNCEHLVDACATLADTLLRTAPDVRILATSREALGVAGERAWLIPPMSLPPDGGDRVRAGADAGDPATTGSEAMQLFVERARDVLPAFALTAANRAAVAQICRRLDGLPLAIELAAARVRVLPPEQLAGRLDDAFHALGGGKRAALPRHRTLRAVMDWSYALLAEPERVLLQRLAVFDGGFDLDAVEAVCGAAPLDGAAVLDLLAALVDRSLVVMRESDGRARYRLLETVRQYAADELRRSGAEHDVRRRHASCFVELAATAEPHLITVERRAWVQRLRLDTDNLRQALTWTREHEPATHVRLAGMLGWFWFSTRDWLEGRRWLEAALALPEAAAPTRERAAALFAAGMLATLQARTASALPWLEESATIAESLGDDRLTAYARNYTGMAYLQSGRPEGEAPTIAALEWFRAHDDLYGLRLSYLMLGTLEMSRGDLDRAEELVTEGVRIARMFGVNRELGVALQMHAGVSLARGDLDRAAALARESLVALWDDPMYLFMARGIEMLGTVQADRGDVRRATRLCAAAAAIRATIGAEPFALDRQRVQPILERARTTLGDAEYGKLWRAGSNLGVEDVYAELDGEATVAGGVDTAVTAGPAAAGIAEPANADPAAAASARAAPTPAEHSGTLRVRALGGLEVVRSHSGPLHWPYARPRELFVYLLCHPEGRTREQIGVTFWPEASAAQVKNSFHVTLHHLRRTLGTGECVRFEDDRYRIDPRLTVEFDAARFETTARAALREVRAGGAPLDALRDALALYRGHFLSGVLAGDWHLEVHDRLQLLCIDAHAALGRLLIARAEWREAADVYERLIRFDDLHEEAHRQLMRCYAELGERTRALRTYDRLVARLADELDLEPDEETAGLAAELRGTRL